MSETRSWRFEIYRTLFADDRQAGGTTPLSAWTVLRSQKGSESILVIDPTAVHCDCCSTYKGWKQAHPVQHRKFLDDLSVPVFYKSAMKKYLLLRMASKYATMALFEHKVERREELVLGLPLPRESPRSRVTHVMHWVMASPAACCAS